MGKNNFPDAYVFPIVHVAVFASAIAMMCLVRHALYAAILGVAFMYLGVLLAVAAWYIAGLVGWLGPNPRIMWEPTLMQVATALIASIVISTLVAWFAMRNDWGRRARIE